MLLSKPDDSGGSNKGVTPTPWLLYGVLAFVDQYLGMVFQSILNCYFISLKDINNFIQVLLFFFSLKKSC